MIVFPNRIENDRNGKLKQLHLKAKSFCYAVGFAAVFLSDANRINLNNFTEVLKCSGGVTRQNPPNPAGAFGSRVENPRGQGGITPLYQKVSRNHQAPKDLRWHHHRSYDALNFWIQLGRQSGHPEEPKGN